MCEGTSSRCTEVDNVVLTLLRVFRIMIYSDLFSDVVYALVSPALSGNAVASAAVADNSFEFVMLVQLWSALEADLIVSTYAWEASH